VSDEKPQVRWEKNGLVAGFHRRFGDQWYGLVWPHHERDGWSWHFIDITKAKPKPRDGIWYGTADGEKEAQSAVERAWREIVEAPKRRTAIPSDKYPPTAPLGRKTQGQKK
jgi:hypothetical protein